MRVEVLDLFYYAFIDTAHMFDYHIRVVPGSLLWFLGDLLYLSVHLLDFRTVDR